jgi:ribosomal protein S6E (S10)
MREKTANIQPEVVVAIDFMKTFSQESKENDPYLDIGKKPQLYLKVSQRVIDKALLDKGKLRATGGRKATGPTRIAGLPKAARNGAVFCAAVGYVPNRMTIWSRRIRKRQTLRNQGAQNSRA